MTMSKKRTKSGTIRMNARRVEAPKLVTRETSDLELAHEDIARLAYLRFVDRGSADGFHLEDWLAAEAELRGARSK